MSNLLLNDCLTFAFWSPGPAEMLVIAVVALLLYGGNLPEVARSWGKSFAEFRRGLSGFQNELNEVIYSEPDQLAYDEEVGRDDSRLAQGYEEPDEYEAPEDVDDSDQTVRDVSADTIVVEKPDSKPDDAAT